MKNTLNSVAWSVRRILRNVKTLVGGYRRTVYSQEGEDLILNRLLRERVNGFYVDIGAHHPVRFSNTFFFYKRRWSGINVEPNPEVIRLFGILRPRDKSVCMAIGRKEGRRRYFMFFESAFNTLDEMEAAGRESAGHVVVRAMDVRVTTLAKLLSEHCRDDIRIDFMNVDVEGMDLEVLESNDWDRFRPTYVVCEERKRRCLEVIDGDVAKFLCGQGYELVAKTMNSVVYQRMR